MNFCKIKNKDHIIKLIDFLYEEIISSSGDGDGLWFSKFYNIEDIFPLIKEYNDKLKFPWMLEMKESYILWGENQEWLIVTNSEEEYLKAPSWQQILIKY